ncbi:hypothetical protein GEOBC_01664 [Geobacteraceae bacterium]|nr:hypothetical protein GEOBC_01664 [Geobacteraceae bacterium]
MFSHDVTEFGSHNEQEAARHRTVLHGTRCGCSLLAAALGLRPDAISFYYCRNVLQRRWTMTCMHGVVESIDEPMDLTGKWKDEAEMNPVLAILLKNA